ncbi:MAG: helix-turn-helix domain-containing protein [Oscillospiraceae bacterium]|nr:helix-turn-helix domain-containing protein [Oscillospiraceae bacterium]
MQLDLGNKIRQLRHRDGRTQEALAEALGVTSQAVSRWEASGSYPDMNLIPSIANYFGVTIDELFGYTNEREQKVDALVKRIMDMKWENNGIDASMDECITLARNALVEFPGNERLMLCLASVLYTAGYSRYGEHHLTDDEGYDVYDAQRHRGYAEWQEAIPLYEKVLKTLPSGEERDQAVSELSQLYVNIGESEKALALAEVAPDLWGSKQFLRVYACDGKQQAKECSQTLLYAVHSCAALIMHCVCVYKNNMTSAEKVQSIRGAITLFEQVCTDGNYGAHSSFISKLYGMLAVYLWLEGKQDEAFESMDQALAYVREFWKMYENPNAAYTAPLVRLAKPDLPLIVGTGPQYTAASLPEDWPWWSVPEEPQVKEKMQQDLRWAEWVARTQE